MGRLHEEGRAVSALCYFHRRATAGPDSIRPSRREHPSSPWVHRASRFSYIVVYDYPPNIQLINPIVIRLAAGWPRWPTLYAQILKSQDQLSDCKPCTYTCVYIYKYSNTYLVKLVEVHRTYYIRWSEREKGVFLRLVPATELLRGEIVYNT